MAKKPNNPNVEDVSALSQYDNGQVLRDAHSLPGHYLRVKESHSLIPDFFDYFTAIYDGNGKPTQACYYAGTKPHLTTIVYNPDISGSLAGTYFLISSGRKGKTFAVVYTVNGSGTIPSIPNVENIIVDIMPNDAASIICVATDIALRPYNLYFTTSRQNSVLEITTVKLGVSNDTTDTGSTGFLLVNSAGESSLIGKVDLTYSVDGNPIWQGQELVGHIYNLYTTRFESSVQVAVTGDIQANSVIRGTDDGTDTGTEYIFINNVKQQILASHDRDQAISYADFGTKNERIITIDYTSPTFPAVTARKSITYTLVGTRYRRDNITWTIV